jgi:hypothetical protein
MACACLMMNRAWSRVKVRAMSAAGPFEFLLGAT